MAKIFESSRIDGAINRAFRRKRISKEACTSCRAAWPKLLATRPYAVKWHLVAVALLARVAALRLAGNVQAAKQLLPEVKAALRNSHRDSAMA